MIYLILSLSGVIATSVIKSTWSLKRQVSFILSALFLVLIIFWGIDFMLENSSIIEKTDSSVWDKIPWFDIILYFTMIMGMAAKYFYDVIGVSRRKKIIIRKWQLIRPFFISPLVFGALYSYLDQTSSEMLLLIFAFQNGFFWQTILCKYEK